MIGIISDTHDNVPNIIKAVELFKEKNVEFVGWIKDKKSFFEEIDIFCILQIWRSTFTFFNVFFYRHNYFFNC